MDQDGDIRRDTAAVSTATKGRVRGNGSGSVYYDCNLGKHTLEVIA